MTKGPAGIRRLEGRPVSVCLADGSRIDDCELVSGGRGQTETLWMLTAEGDTFVRLADVDAVWEVTRERLGRAS